MVETGETVDIMVGYAAGARAMPSSPDTRVDSAIAALHTTPLHTSTHVVPQSTLAMNSPCRSSLPASIAENPLNPPSRPRMGWAAASLAKLLLRLATFSLASGCVGDPARERSDGVGGPEYSCLVMGRGPLAYDERRDRPPEPGCPPECEPARTGRGATMDGRLEVGGDAKGEECGDSWTADSLGSGDMSFGGYADKREVKENRSACVRLCSLHDKLEWGWTMGCHWLKMGSRRNS